MAHVLPTGTSPSGATARSTPVDSSAPAAHRRRVTTLALLVCLAAGSAAGLAGGLVSFSPTQGPQRPRPLSAPEAQRLAAMRLQNFRDARVALRATLGSPGADIRLAGWVDWSRTLVYLTVSGPAAGAQEGLLQAAPTVLATRAARVTTAPASASATNASAAPAPPPVVPPADGWRIRPLTAAGVDPGSLESLIALLFAVANDGADPADLLRHSEARWLGRDRTDGTPVDVLLGPAVPPPVSTPSGDTVPTSAPAGTPTTGPTLRSRTATSLAAMGGAVRYWLDDEARLHRFEALLPRHVPVKVDFTRGDRSGIAAIAALGGRPVSPRGVTAAEADTLARMRQRNRAALGGQVRLTVPTLPAATLRGVGWVDWRKNLAYLAVRDLDKPTEGLLMRAGRNGVAVRTAPKSDRPPSPDDLPPLPPPRERDWGYTRWEERGDALGGLDLDLLINEVLLVGGGAREEAEPMRTSAVWLRKDNVGGTPVSVFEIPKAAERGTPPGQARLRYWVDRSGGLRRLELRTRIGAFAQLDIDRGDVPYVASVPIA